MFSSLIRKTPQRNKQIKTMMCKLSQLELTACQIPSSQHIYNTSITVQKVAFCGDVTPTRGHLKSTNFKPHRQISWFPSVYLRTEEEYQNFEIQGQSLAIEMKYFNLKVIWCSSRLTCCHWLDLSQRSFEAFQIRRNSKFSLTLQPWWTDLLSYNIIYEYSQSAPPKCRI